MEFSHKSECISVTITLNTKEIKKLLNIFDIAQLSTNPALNTVDNEFIKSIVKEIDKVFPDNQPLKPIY